MPSNGFDGLGQKNPAWTCIFLMHNMNLSMRSDLNQVPVFEWGMTARSEGWRSLPGLNIWNLRKIYANGGPLKGIQPFSAPC